MLLAIELHCCHQGDSPVLTILRRGEDSLYTTQTSLERRHWSQSEKVPVPFQLFSVYLHFCCMAPPCMFLEVYVVQPEMPFRDN